MDLMLLAGSANRPLAETIAAALGVDLGRVTIDRFPDGEVHISVDESVRGQDVYLIQPTSPPVGEHLLELLLLADACHRAGASRVTAVVPYFGYARQDRRATGREPVSARVVADLLQTTEIDRVLAVDLHGAALEGFFRIPLEHLSAVPLLADAARPVLGDQGVVVSPDLGAVKLAEHYAARLGTPVAIVHKTRLSGEEVRAERIVGEVRGRRPLVIDDMISTGGTIEAAVNALLAAGCIPDVAVAATHGLLVGAATQRLSAIPLRRLITTDSVLRASDLAFPLEVVGIGPLLGEAIGRLHNGGSISDLIGRPS